jgi:hypothetical protein
VGRRKNITRRCLWPAAEKIPFTKTRFSASIHFENEIEFQFQNHDSSVKQGQFWVNEMDRANTERLQRESPASGRANRGK